jgi:hypothetical protein
MDYNSCYMASLGYGTVATSLSTDECKEIQKPPVNAILPKMGINRNTKREYILGHLRSDDTLRTLYRTLMEFTHLEYGTREEILSCDFDKYEKNILTPNWITECWRFLKQFDAIIENTGTWKPLQGRKGDAALMEVFINKNFIAKEMKDTNRCIIYLQVFYLSDVTDIDGHHIEPWVSKGKLDGTRSSKWECPIQQRPPMAAWKVWNNAIEEASTEEEDITHQLGRWYDEGGHQHTEWYLSAREETLYRCKDGKWEQHEAKQ